MFKKFTKETDCNRYRNLIQKRLNCEITPEENEELDGHLADCPVCIDELTGYAMVQDVLTEEKENPVDVPEGFFENMASELDGVKPAFGWKGLLANPFFGSYRNIALGTASLVLVAILTASVGSGAIGRFSTAAPGYEASNASAAQIQMNNGDTILLTGDEGNPDKYSAAIDDLERSYREAQGAENGSGTDGYMHTSWKDGESATPIR